MGDTLIQNITLELPASEFLLKSMANTLRDEASVNLTFPCLQLKKVLIDNAFQCQPVLFLT